MELYTVREAANLLNVAVQSIYTKIDKAEKENSEKYISIGSDKLKRVTADFMLDYYGYTGEAAAATEAAEQKIIDFYRDELDRERKRSAAERERLTAENDKLHAELDRLHTEIAQLIQMNMNNQTLLLMEKKTAPAADESEGANDPTAPEVNDQTADAAPVKKKGLFDRIFGRDS